MIKNAACERTLTDPQSLRERPLGVRAKLSPNRSRLKDCWTVDDLGATLRRAREAAGLSLAGMAKRSGYSRGYLGNVETGVRAVTPALIKAYEKVFGGDVNRRGLLIGSLSSLVTALDVPDVAGDIATSVHNERSQVLTSAQTSHELDKTIAALVARDTPSIAALANWSRRGNAVLRVNAVGILAKIGSPALDRLVARHLAADTDVRQLYLTAVLSRVLSLPWNEAGHLARSHEPLATEGHLGAITRELRNETDAGARWCSIALLFRARHDARREVDAALVEALASEPSSEHLRAIGFVLAGVDPTTA